jgi:Bacterial protein of unknown function (DUF924)
MQPDAILHFWFEELTDKQHFAKDTALDALIAQRFGALLESAARCELFAWRATPAGRLAEISFRATCGVTHRAPLRKTRWRLPWRKSWCSVVTMCSCL